jgi:prohibitin 2
MFDSIKTSTKRIMVSVVIFFIAFLICFPIAVVPPGHTGIRVTFGNVNMTPVLSGIYLKPPWFIQQMVKMDCRVQKHDTTAGAASKDLQEVKAEIVVNYKVSISKSAELFKNVGSLYRDIIISPATQESIKAVTSQFTAEELITRRSEVSLRIKELLDKRLEP